MFLDRYHVFYIFLAGACLSTAHPSSELSLDQLRKHYRVHQVESGLKQSGPKALLGLHHKYNIPPSSELINAATSTRSDITADVDQASNSIHASSKRSLSPRNLRNSSGTVTTYHEPHDRAYLTAFTIGTQTLKLDIDTGSSDFWVFSTLLPTAQRGRGHTLYDPGLSQTAHLAEGYHFSVDYGDKSRASGIVYTDHAAVAANIPWTTQAIEVATNISSIFTEGSGDGIAGFGFDQHGNTCKPHYCRSFFANVAPALDAPLIGVALSHAAPGHFDFGFIDTARFTGTLTWATVDPIRGYWQFNAAGYAIGTQGTAQEEGFIAVADTGTSIVLLAPDIVTAYWSQVVGSSYSTSQGAYVFPCMTPDADIPAFCILIGARRLCMPGSYAKYRSVGGGMCYGAIQPSLVGYSIIGDSFLKSMYVVFDLGGMRVGFAPQVGVVA